MSTTTRPRVLLVTTHWGTSLDESVTATRLLAGALARSADVDVAHLDEAAREQEVTRDSVFEVHRLPLRDSALVRSDVLRAALAVKGAGRLVPERAARLMEHYEGHAEGVGELIAKVDPAAIVLVGHRQPFDRAVLGERGTPGRARLIFVPQLNDFTRLSAEHVADLVDRCDVVAASHPGEERALRRVLSERQSDVKRLEYAFNLNRSAAAQGLFGLRYFGRYVLLIRSFPPGGPRFSRSLTHELLRMLLRDVSVAEVDGEKWRVSDAENTLELPVNPTRVNLWRLMAHAICTVDLRPAGPIGQEAIESMLLGTPVVAAEHSAAMELVAAGDAGLWYRDFGELIDATRVLMDPTVRRALSRQAYRYGATHHMDMAAFVEQVRALVLDASPSRYSQRARP